MEAIKDRYEIALQTLKTLQESLNRLEENTITKDYLFICDSIIQRFEYSIDTFWKFLKLYMSNTMNIAIDIASPKPILREAVNATIITTQEFEILSKAISHRNETSYAYNQDLAHDILEKIPLYYETMLVVLERLKT